jgi:hypothetical protein
MEPAKWRGELDPRNEPANEQTANERVKWNEGRRKNEKPLPGVRRNGASKMPL